jgi:hypothetical protein
LAVTDLEVHGGSGLWASANPDTVKQKMLEAAANQQKQLKEDEEERRKMEQEAAQDGGRGGRGGRGRGERGGFGYGGEGSGGRGGFGRGYGGGDFPTTKDGVMIVQPKGGVPTQGFEDIQDRSWVVVLGKIPVKKQFDAYEETLSNARGYSQQADTPVYKGYQVERSEITESGAGPWQLIEKAVTAKTITSEIAWWPGAQASPEVPGNETYVHPLLTHPLPPMVLREWGPEVTHSGLPLIRPEDMYSEAGGAFGQEEDESAALDSSKDEKAKGDDDPFASKKPRVPPGGMLGGEMGAYGPGMRGGPTGGYGAGMRGAEGYGGRGPGMGGYGGAGGGMYGRGESGGRGGYGGMGGYGGLNSTGEMQIELPEYQWDGRTKFALFRYFDTTALPGHRYRYRVRLVLDDVNGTDNTMEKYVDKEVSERRKKSKGYVFTDWSEPSPIASVPQAGRVFVAEAKPSSANVGSEPEARLLVKTLDKAQLAEAALGSWFTRGAVINQMATKAQIIWSQAINPGEEEQSESPDFNFVTGLTLLDFRGGEELNKNRDLKAPASVLFMDSAGKLILKNELDDVQTVREYDYMIKSKKEGERRQKEQAEGGGRGGFGGRR